MKFIRVLKSSLLNENSLGEPISNDPQVLQNFWNWFNDSKIVDDQGRPLVVYHGTKSKFDTFLKDKQSDYSSFSKGFYFTPDKDLSNKHGLDINLSVYLYVKNPYISKSTILVHSLEKDFNITYKEIAEKYNEGYYKTEPTAMALTKYITSLGYDGIIDNYEPQIVVFESNQIKSISNNTNYSTEDNSIYGSKL